MNLECFNTMIEKTEKDIYKEMKSEKKKMNQIAHTRINILKNTKTIWENIYTLVRKKQRENTRLG